MTASDYADNERDAEEAEAQDKAVVLSIVKAIQDLVVSTTDDTWELERCDQICGAVIDFAFRDRREPLQAHRDAHAAWCRSNR